MQQLFNEIHILTLHFWVSAIKKLGCYLNFNGKALDILNVNKYNVKLYEYIIVYEFYIYV